MSRLLRQEYQAWYLWRMQPSERACVYMANGSVEMAWVGIPYRSRYMVLVVQ